MFCVLNTPNKFNKHTLRASFRQVNIGTLTAINKLTFDELSRTLDIIF